MASGPAARCTARWTAQGKAGSSPASTVLMPTITGRLTTSSSTPALGRRSEPTGARSLPDSNAGRPVFSDGHHWRLPYDVARCAKSGPTSNGRSEKRTPRLVTWLFGRTVREEPLEGPRTGAQRGCLATPAVRAASAPWAANTTPGTHTGEFGHVVLPLFFTSSKEQLTSRLNDNEIRHERPATPDPLQAAVRLGARAPRQWPSPFGTESPGPLAPGNARARLAIHQP
jgi:hypothetical protein